jgi:PPOX class probable F420-dependent enzyme
MSQATWNVSRVETGENMIDLTTELGKRLNYRLSNEEVIWFTIVTKLGVPQPNPVWFYWDGKIILIYSRPGSYRIRNLQYNPMVSLNLQGVDVLGNNVAVILGEATTKINYSQVHPGYKTKY